MNLLGVVLLVAISLSPAPRDRAEQQSQPNNNQESTGQIASPTPPAQSVPVIDKHSSEKKTKKTDGKSGYICRATAPEYLSQWVLVVVGGVGIVFGLRSLALLRRQVEIEADPLDLARESTPAAP